MGEGAPAGPRQPAGEKGGMSGGCCMAPQMGIEQDCLVVSAGLLGGWCCGSEAAEP